MVWALVSNGVSAHTIWCEMTWKGAWWDLQFGQPNLQVLEGGYKWVRKWVTIKKRLAPLWLTYDSCFCACSARWTFNVNVRQWAVNVSQFRVLTHARGNGLSYCALTHAAECKHSFGGSLETHIHEAHPMWDIYPQRAKHAINDHFHSYAVAKPLTDIAHHSPQRKHWRSLTANWRTLTLKTARSANIHVQSPQYLQKSATYFSMLTYILFYF